VIRLVRLPPPGFTAASSSRPHEPAVKWICETSAIASVLKGIVENSTGYKSHRLCSFGACRVRAGPSG
jgi:hypothetical protein